MEISFFKYNFFSKLVCLLITSCFFSLNAVTKHHRDNQPILIILEFGGDYNFSLAQILCLIEQNLSSVSCLPKEGVEIKFFNDYSLIIKSHPKDRGIFGLFEIHNYEIFDKKGLLVTRAGKGPKFVVDCNRTGFPSWFEGAINSGSFLSSMGEVKF